jgi:hypothetical protein
MEQSARRKEFQRLYRLFRRSGISRNLVSFRKTGAVPCGQGRWRGDGAVMGADLNGGLEQTSDAWVEKKGQQL